MWWQEVVPGDWYVFGMPEDLVRGRIVYQEHDAVLDRLLATQDASVTPSKAHLAPHDADR